jgi:ferredoxin
MKPVVYPVDVLPLSIPCMGMISPDMLLKSFAVGARGLIVLYGDAPCYSTAKIDKWAGVIHFIQALLKRWDVNPERIKLIKIDRSGLSGLETCLTGFSDYIRTLPPLDLRVEHGKTECDDNRSLAYIIGAIERKKGIPPQGELSTGDVPFGNLRINQEECTGCGVCAVECPHGALFFEIKENNIRNLLFRHELCRGCGLCVNICPQACLQMERVLQFDKLGQKPEVLFEDEELSCRICGQPFASSSMICSIRTKLEESDFSSESIEICGGCKSGRKNGLVADPAGREYI